MPLSNKKNLPKALVESSARLAPIYKQLQKEVFGEDTQFVFFGGAVRESLLGGVISEIDVELSYEGSTFFWAAAIDYLRNLNPESFERDSEDSRFAGNFRIKSQLGVEYKINVWFIKPKVIWSCDDVTFKINKAGQPIHYGDQAIPTFSHYDSNEIFIVDYDEVTADNVKDHLTYGVELITRYGWQIQQKTLNKLNSIMEQAKPLDMVYETITGFRSFKINQRGQLQGFHSTVWDTAELEVDCPEFRIHIKESDETSGGNPVTSDGSLGHGCGIYVYKDLMECIMNYKGEAIAIVVANGGDVWEGERGYRVEKARIEKLWVFRGSPTLRANYQINGGVIVDCTRTEAIREILSSGIKIDSERALL